MKDNQTVRLMTPGHMKELIAAVVEGIPSDLSHDAAQKLIGKKKRIAKGVRGVLLEREDSLIATNYAKEILDWQNFYERVFNLNIDLGANVIPARPEQGKWRLLFIANISLEDLYAKCNKLFNCWRWTESNFDQIVTQNERAVRFNSGYAIWVKDEVEADEDLKNLSANDIKGKGIATETLAERLIHELKFFDETGKHLDIDNVTLCSGSRYGDGDVPSVYWDSYDGRMSVRRYSPGNAYGLLRSRQVVS